MRRSIVRGTMLTVLAASLFLLPACDSGGSNDAQNEFSMTVSSKKSSKAFTSRTLDGFSFFVDTDDLENTTEDAFAIYLNGTNSLSSDSPPEKLFGLIGRAGTQPDAGTYPLADGTGRIVDSDLRGFIYEDVQNSNTLPYYVIIGGTLTLNTSTESKVAGSLDAEAIAYTFTGSGQNITVDKDTVIVDGQFSAKSADAYFPIGDYNP